MGPIWIQYSRRHAKRPITKFLTQLGVSFVMSSRAIQSRMPTLNRAIPGRFARATAGCPKQAPEVSGHRTADGRTNENLLRRPSARQCEQDDDQPREDDCSDQRLGEEGQDEGLQNLLPPSRSSLADGTRAKASCLGCATSDAGNGSAITSRVVRGRIVRTPCSGRRRSITAANG